MPGRRVPRSKESRGDEDQVMSPKISGIHSTYWYIIASITVIFLLQSLSEMLSTIYYHSLVELTLHPSVLLILVFFAPIGVGPLTRRLGWRAPFFILGALSLMFRLPMGMGLDGPLHMIFSILTFVSSSLLLSIILALHRRERALDPDAFSSQGMTASFGLALLFLILMRAGGRGVDISIVPGVNDLILSPGLSAFLCAAMAFFLLCFRDCRMLRTSDRQGGAPDSIITGGLADSWMPVLGLGGFIFIASALLSNPAVTAAWLGTPFHWALMMTMLAVSLFILSMLGGSGWLLQLRRSFSNPKGAIIGNIVLLASAANLFYLHIHTPTAPVAFSWIAMVNLWVIIDAWTDSGPFAGETIEVERKDGGRKLIGFPGKERKRRFAHHFGKASAISMAVPILLSLLLAVAYNWSFVPLGSFLKGTVSSLMFLGALLFALGGFSCSKAGIDEPSTNIFDRTPKIGKGSPSMAAGEGSGHLRHRREASPRLRFQWLTIGALTIVLILVMGGVSFPLYSGDIEEKTVETGEPIRVMTYNIHHGFDNQGSVDPVKHLEIIEDVDPDVILLQECGMVHPAGGSIDPVFFLASSLGMYYYRGSDPGLDSPGAAILSKFKLTEGALHHLPSDGIERVAVSAKADLGDVKVRLVSVHLGLEEDEREKQFEDLAATLYDMDDEIILGGDLNTEPDEEMLLALGPNLTGKGDIGPSDDLSGPDLRSAWHMASEEARDGPLDSHTYPAKGLDNEKKHIDYILISEEFKVLKADIEHGEGASDHRPVWCDVVLRDV